MNQPYVKHYDENGSILNPIIGEYKSEFPNRRKRNEKPDRFNNNRKTHSIVVWGTFKYAKVSQPEFDKEGNKKTIQQYLLK